MLETVSTVAGQDQGSAHPTPRRVPGFAGFGLVVSVLKKDSCARLGIFERLDPIGDFSVEPRDDLALGDCSFDEKIDRTAHCAVWAS